jgi:hypothetical protein
VKSSIHSWKGRTGKVCMGPCCAGGLKVLDRSLKFSTYAALESLKRWREAFQFERKMDPFLSLFLNVFFNINHLSYFTFVYSWNSLLWVEKKASTDFAVLFISITFIPLVICTYVMCGILMVFQTTAFFSHHFRWVIQNIDANV